MKPFGCAGFSFAGFFPTNGLAISDLENQFDFSIQP